MQQDSAEADPTSAKLLIFIVSYNAEKTILPVLSRIPPTLFSDPSLQVEILIIDDGSKDETFRKGLEYRASFTECPITVLKNPMNLGYGGNQKLGYHYAIENGFQFVALIHGDGQYAPEQLPYLLEPLRSKAAGAVFGSRMLVAGNARSGGMPLYKFFGNKILSFLQNRIVGLRLSEWHSGYRLYSIELLKRIPFERNSNGFDFDTDIIIQIKAANGVIKELPIPTFYGDEICHVNGIQYSIKIITACAQFFVQHLGIFYNPKFDLVADNTYYLPKFDYLSSHSLSLANVEPTDSCLLLGSGPLPLVQPFLDRARTVSVIDMQVQADLKAAVHQAWEGDLDVFSFEVALQGTCFSKVFALDVIEHLKNPEAFLEHLRSTGSCKGAELILTTPNIAFLPQRLMLLFGAFNYGKRGILDKTHTRLFTIASLRRLFVQSGYQVLEMRGVPPPIPLALGEGLASRLVMSLATIATRVFPSLFGFQIFVRAIASPTVEQLLADAVSHSANLQRPN